MDLRAQLQAHPGSAVALWRELGAGGMSRVSLVNEVRLSRKVVVKALNPVLVQGLNAERFEREILLVASLQQANIVPVLAAGEVQRIPYYTMPYVEGESLRTRLTGSGPGIGGTVSILRDVTKPLADAHAHGTVHRDIKPDNVLLSGGTAVVTDFGIAKALAASQTGEHAVAGPWAALTRTGTSKRKADRTWGERKPDCEEPSGTGVRQRRPSGPDASNPAGFRWGCLVSTSC